MNKSSYPNATVMILAFVSFIKSRTSLSSISNPPCLQSCFPSVINMIAPPVDESPLPFKVYNGIFIVSLVLSKINFKLIFTIKPCFNPSPKQVPPSASKSLIALTKMFLFSSEIFWRDWISLATSLKSEEEIRTFFDC